MVWRCECGWVLTETYPPAHLDHYLKRGYPLIECDCGAKVWTVLASGVPEDVACVWGEHEYRQMVYRERRNECGCGKTFDSVERFPFPFHTDYESRYLEGEECPVCQTKAEGLTHWWLTDPNPEGSVFTWKEAVA